MLEMDLTMYFESYGQEAVVNCCLGSQLTSNRWFRVTSLELLFCLRRWGRGGGSGRGLVTSNSGGGNPRDGSYIRRTGQTILLHR